MVVAVVVGSVVVVVFVEMDQLIDHWKQEEQS